MRDTSELISPRSFGSAHAAGNFVFCDGSVQTLAYTIDQLTFSRLGNRRDGSEDGSPEIAREHGARVVHVGQRGYGAALRGGIAAERGKYVVMGDADCSYDFGEVPRFLGKLQEGYDVVMGN